MSESKELNEVSKLKKKDAYYIASGFFNKDQEDTVSAIENSLKGLNINYFSPRSESIPFFGEQDEELKSMMTKLIFNNNLDSMNSCNKYIINLQDEDQGTLFEYGYIAGDYYRIQTPAPIMSSCIKVLNDKTNLEKLVLQAATDLPDNLKHKGADQEFVFKQLKDLPNLNSLYEENEIGIFCIDDRDPINLFLIGVYFRMEIPVITYSHKGYGSNVMLMHSTSHFDKIEELTATLVSLEADLVALNKFSGEMNLTEDEVEVGLSSIMSTIFLNRQKWDINID